MHQSIFRGTLNDTNYLESTDALSGVAPWSLMQFRSFLFIDSSTTMVQVYSELKKLNLQRQVDRWQFLPISGIGQKSKRDFLNFIAIKWTFRAHLSDAEPFQWPLGCGAHSSRSTKLAPSEEHLNLSCSCIHLGWTGGKSCT